MSKSNEELAAIMLSGYLSRADLSVRTKSGSPRNINGEFAAKLLKEWTEAIDKSKAHEGE